MEKSTSPTLGLAFSGSGNRTTFYIGFLEVLSEAGVKADYISACSGGSLVAAAYACGTLKEFKQIVFDMSRKELMAILTQKRGNGGLYSLEVLEELLRDKVTRGLHFDEVKTLMSFSAVDIESGESVDLCIGEIASAARISCTVPGIFEPIKWGNRTLVDGGLLMFLPVKPLKNFGADVIVGISTGGTSHIFAPGFLSVKKFLDFFKKSLFVKEIKLFASNFYPKNLDDRIEIPNLFTTLGRSMDLAIQANSKIDLGDSACDLVIKMKVAKANKIKMEPENLKKLYELGRASAAQNLPKIKQLLKAKSVV
jgi:NTE family protein